jgi:hypothetical protein
MRRLFTAVAALFIAALPAFAAHKIQGTGTLRDSQPTGTTDKQHKHQAYDLSFDAAANRYTCRTDASKSMNPTDFVVGGAINYEIDGQKVTLTTPAGKKVECKVVRVEAVSAAPPLSQQ